MGEQTDERPLIVAVEDDAEIFKLTEIRLRSKYKLLWAKNDREACALIAAHGRTLYAVLMDLELGGSQLDGIALIKLVRGKLENKPDYASLVPKLSSLPIIVLTATASPEIEAELRTYGASHYLTKPIDFMRLNLALAQANIASVMSRLAGRRDSTEIPVISS